jgi:hypothetical protein
MNLDPPFFLSGIDFAGKQPCLLFGAPARSKRESLPVINTTFTLRRIKRRYCIGRYDLATFEVSACPDNTLLDDDAKKVRCDRCEYFCGFNPSFYRTEAVSPQQRAYNAQPHAVYLAYFGSRAVKVGISHERRLRTRLLEQGARAAAVVAVVANAFEARRIEERLSAAGIAEHIGSSAKRRLLNERFNADVAFDELRRTRSRIVSIAPDLSQEMTADPFDLSSSQLSDRPLRLPILDLSSTRPLVISGRGIGIIGDTLLVEQNGATFMMGLKQVISHVVVLEFAEISNAAVAAEQAALF